VTNLASTGWGCYNIDFLGIDNILNSPHDDYGESYTEEEKLYVYKGISG
jgi:hypothetical protein